MTVNKNKIFRLLEIVCQQILAVFVLLVYWEVWKVSDLSTLGAWHILLCVSGVALYVAEGVQVFNRESLFFQDTPKEDRVVPHGAIMGLGLVNVIIGVILKIKEKADASQEHFVSTHAILGLVAWISLVFVVIGGLITAAKGIMSGQKRALKILHIIVGVTAYLLGIITVGFGLGYMLTEKGRNSLIVLMSIYVAYSLINPIMSLINHFR